MCRSTYVNVHQCLPKNSQEAMLHGRRVTRVELYDCMTDWTPTITLQQRRPTMQRKDTKKPGILLAGSPLL